MVLQLALFSPLALMVSSARNSSEAQQRQAGSPIESSS